jgi:hypothetical protein
MQDVDCEEEDDDLPIREGMKTEITILCFIKNDHVTQRHNVVLSVLSSSSNIPTTSQIHTAYVNVRP